MFSGEERTIGELAVKLGGPAAGNLGGAARTGTLGGEAVILNEITVAADQRFPALRAARIFQRADHAGKIAGIDVAQSRGTSDLCGAEQIPGRSIALVIHLVIGMKCGHMPRNINGNAREEFGELAEFLLRVVEAGNQEGDDLQPETDLVNATDALKDRTDSSAELMIVTVVEALEIHFVEIDPWAQKFKHLRRGVAIRHKSSEQSRSLGFLEDRDSPLAGDQGLIVGADHDLRTLIERVANNVFRRNFQRR